MHINPVNVTVRCGIFSLCAHIGFLATSGNYATSSFLSGSRRRRRRLDRFLDRLVDATCNVRVHTYLPRSRWFPPERYVFSTFSVRLGRTGTNPRYLYLYSIQEIAFVSSYSKWSFNRAECDACRRIPRQTRWKETITRMMRHDKLSSWRDPIFFFLKNKKVVCLLFLSFIKRFAICQQWRERKTPQKHARMSSLFWVNGHGGSRIPTSFTQQQRTCRHRRERYRTLEPS